LLYKSIAINQNPLDFTMCADDYNELIIIKKKLQTAVWMTVVYTAWSALKFWDKRISKNKYIILKILTWS